MFIFLMEFFCVEHFEGETQVSIGECACETVFYRFVISLVAASGTLVSPPFRTAGVSEFKIGTTQSIKVSA